jgi:hypothetical protein
MAFKIKQNDTLPTLPFTILQPDGVTPQDLTNVTSISMVVRTKGAASTAPPLFKKPCTILLQSVPANKGKGTFTWVAADTATSGAFEYEFEIIWNDGGIQTVPADGYLDLTITDDIG